MKTLLKVKEKYRVDTLAQVEAFHDELKIESSEQGYRLVGFAYKDKVKKKNKEIEDEWKEVDIVKVFNEGE